jgi:hypothetical protein
MAHDAAACRRSDLAMSDHVPGYGPDDCAFDTSLRVGLKRRHCGNDDERGEYSRPDFHVASPILLKVNGRNSRFETPPHIFGMAGGEFEFLMTSSCRFSI